MKMLRYLLGLLPTEEDDVLKQIQAFFRVSTKGITALAGSSPDSQPPSTENAFHFRDESLEKVTDLTSKRRVTSL
jgi:hypothetical protein